MTTLYDLDSDIAGLLASLDACDGEIPEALAADLDQLEAARITKVHALCATIRNKESRIAGLQAELDRLSKAKQVEANRIEWLKRYLKDSMERHCEKSVQTALFTVRVQRSPASVLCGLAALDTLPAEFVRTRTTTDVDKAAVLEAWKAGKPLPEGVEVVQSSHVRIS